MLENLRHFIADLTSADGQENGHERRPFAGDDYRLAAAGLFIHLITIDGKPSDVETSQLHGLLEQRFDLEPTERLSEEVARLVAAGRFNDILLVRDPVSEPKAGGARRRSPLQRVPTVEETHQARPVDLRPAAEIPERERRDFLREARMFTPLVAAEIDGATYVIRTDRSADEGSLFVRRSHVGLKLLQAALDELDELGLAQAARERAFLEIGAGTGVLTVAALATHGFPQAIACERDLARYRLLKLSAAASRVTPRVRSMPIGLARTEAGHSIEDVSLDFLCRRGLVIPEKVGLTWIEMEDSQRSVLAGGRALLEEGTPLVLAFDSGSGRRDPFLQDGGIVETHTHFVKINKTSSSKSGRPVPIDSLGGFLARGEEARPRSVWLLVVRLTTPA